MDPNSYAWLLYLSSWGVWLAIAALKSLLILLLLEAILAVLAKSLSASARHTLRLLGLLALLVLPLASLGFPKWHLSLVERPALLGEQGADEGEPIQAQVQQELKERVGISETNGGSSHVGISETNGGSSHASGPASGSLSPEASRLLLMQEPAGDTNLNKGTRAALVEIGAGLLVVVWMVGILALLTRVLVGIACVWLVRFRSQEVSDPTLKWVAEAAAARLNLRRRVKLYATPRLEVALSVGVLRVPLWDG